MRRAAVFAYVVLLLLLGWDGSRIVAHMRERVA